MDSITIQQIREQSSYPGLRVRINATIGPWKGTAVWDVSTGDPIVPAPRIVTIERVLGEPIALLGYAPETTLAEKGVTILERGITSTRWRDYVDIVQLARQGVDPDALLRSAHAVARHRGVTLEPIGPHVADYGRVGQAEMGSLASQRTTPSRVRRETRRPDRPHRLPTRPHLRDARSNTLTTANTARQRPHLPPILFVR
jgi:hypothetical protein